MQEQWTRRSRSCFEECAKLFDIERIRDLWKDKIVYYAYSFVAGLTGVCNSL